MSAKLRSHAAPATLVSLAVAPASTVVGLLTLSGAEAANKQPSCGDTITADTTLDSDLVDCPNNGIVIGADDITLDLNGHTDRRRRRAEFAAVPQARVLRLRGAQRRPRRGHRQEGLGARVRRPAS